MNIKSRRRLVVLTGALAAPIVAASAAFACQSLANLTLGSKSAAAGTAVSVSGTGFSSSPSASPIAIRLDSRTAPPLTTVAPASRFTTSFTVPAGTSAGSHIVLGTQTNASGAPQAGTPARAALTVTTGSAADVTGGFTPSDLATPLGVAGLALSMTAFAVRRRRQATSAA